MQPVLNVAEELFLLSLLEKKNAVQVPSTAGLPYILAGAALVDLLLGGAVTVVDGRIVPDESGVAIPPDALTRAALEKIRESGKPRKIEHWVTLLGARRTRLTSAVIAALEEKHILFKDGKLYQWALVDPGASRDAFPPKYLVKRRVRDSLFSMERMDERTAALLGLLDCVGLTGHLFTVDELVHARKKIKALRRAGDAAALVDSARENAADQPATGVQVFAVVSAVEVAIAAAVSGE